MLKTLIEHLKNPDIFPHPVKHFQLIETHISIVLLTGNYAYKFKKSVNMGFLDFSTLDKREFYCQEELRINKRYAEDIYLEVIPITGTVSQPVLAGDGPVIEYAIKMHEFSQSSLFSTLLAKDQLTTDHFIKLAETLSSIHQSVPQAESQVNYGKPEQIFFPVQQNFDQIRPLLSSDEEIQQMEKCERWANAQYQLLYQRFEDRKVKGFVRQCHGDLHLRNIVLYENKPLVFDAIEFNPELQWTDTMADVGFLTMDLLEKNRPDFSIAFLNRYLTLTGDYEGLAILRFYQAYRAVVRAKIYLMQYQQSAEEILRQNYDQSICFAESMIESNQPQLVIMYGTAGSGKTTRAKVLSENLYAIHLRSDVERKRLMTKDFYTEENMQKIYDHLLQMAKNILNFGYSVIVDATFLKKVYRLPFMALAAEMGIPFHIVPCEIDPAEKAKWLSQRQGGYSDADLAVAEKQSLLIEPLTVEENQKIL